MILCRNERSERMRLEDTEGNRFFRGGREKRKSEKRKRKRRMRWDHESGLKRGCIEQSEKKKERKEK